MEPGSVGWDVPVGRPDERHPPGPPGGGSPTFPDRPLRVGYSETEIVDDFERLNQPRVASALSGIRSVPVAFEPHGSQIIFAEER